MISTAIIQARMGSTRLPVKVMLPLADRYILQHVVNRVSQATRVDTVVVAISNEQQDDIIARFVPRFDAQLCRGPESDVLSRFQQAAKQYTPDVLVRVTADCPLISPDTVDKVVQKLVETNADYSTNIINRTFPRGLDVEAFTFESFKKVYRESTSPHHREHVTPYYRERADQFNLVSVGSDEVFDEPWMQDRTDLRLTIDEADDYQLLWEIYERIEYEDILPIKEAVKLIDRENLQQLNANVEQKHLRDASDDQS